MEGMQTISFQDMDMYDSAPSAGHLTAIKRQSEDSLTSLTKRSNLGQDTGFGALWIATVQCPMCMEALPPPLMQCEGGHLICHACAARVSARGGACPCALNL